MRRIPRRPATGPRRRWPSYVIAVVVVVLFLARRAAGFYTDVLWFDSVGFSDVFWRTLGAKILLGVVTGAIVAVLVIANLLLARRLAPPYRVPVPEEAVVERYRQALLPFARTLLIVLGLVVGLLSGLSMVSQWDTVLLWLNAVEFGRNDPHFGRDIGWFVFSLPFQRLLNSWLSGSVLLVLVLSAAAHYLFGGIRPQTAASRVTPAANVHVSVLLAALVAIRAWRFWLDQYLLSYSDRGVVTGLSYTDVNAQLPGYRLLVVIAIACVILFLLNIRYRNYLLPIAGVGILVSFAVLLSGVYPAVVQRLQVAPQELQRESEYITRNLEETRFGFGLQLGEGVTTQPFAAETELTADDVLDNAATLESIRLWDPATLQNTYQQLQELRSYYDFRDVDVDRYDIDGQQQLTLLSVREINERDLPSSSWQNQRLAFTHGYGLVASGASQKTAGGQPVFLAQNIPAEGDAAFQLDNPRVYYGENSPEYSIVGATDEIDFPRAQGEPATFRYDGEGGVNVGGPLRRLAFALRYAEPNFVLSDLITTDSKVLYKRQIRERVEAVAPFLELDHDPYPIAVDGRIKWIQDAYTTTDMVPYSQRVDMGALTLSEQRVLVPTQDAAGNIALAEDVRPLPGIEGQANYIRNSVKVVVDAYDGTITLYTVDEQDPLLKAWDSIFPGSLTPAGSASDELAEHFRYPEDMFRIQSELFLTYHIPDAEQFYTREDAWRTPNDPAFFANQTAPPERRLQRPLRPYYQTLRLPGEESEEFALLQPFTPVGQNRNNLIAFMAGRSDPGVSGELTTYQVPANELVIGPEQAQALINQDDAVSQQITLWNQSGSRVIYGNLLVLPVEQSLLYAQPLFLRSEQSDIPELQRVVLVFGDDVVMEETLAGALSELFGAAPEGLDEETPTEPGEPSEPQGEGGTDPRVRALIMQALERFEAAELALREGDLGTYQRETAAAQALLEQADRILRGLPPEPEETATDAPASEAPGSPATSDTATEPAPGTAPDVEPATPATEAPS